jgi:hypothetical protein
MRLCRSNVLGACFFALLMPALAAPAQTGSAQAPAAPQAEPEQPSDPLGRSTPRGTVLGFLGAARKGEYEIARLTQLSDAPEDSCRQQLEHRLLQARSSGKEKRLSCAFARSYRFC